VSSKSRMKKPNKIKNQDRVHGKGSPIPPDMKLELLPYSITKVCTGGQVITNFHGRKDLVAINWNDKAEIMNVEDFDIVKKISDAIWEDFIKAKNLYPSLGSLPTGLMIHQQAQKRLKDLLEPKYGGKKRVMFIKDTSGCGYWRMVVPMRYMDLSDVYFDMCENEVTYEYLLEYDTIVVQRLHQWREYYTIDRLKRTRPNLRIVYDIDDDIFNIPSSNPASRLLRNDECEAARGIMSIADVITTTTEVLKQSLGFPEKTVVIPNAIDLEDGYPSEWRGSADEYKRILWQGSPTHQEDWEQCFSAVNRIIQDMPNVRLLIMGMLPTSVKQAVDSDDTPWWDGRVEYMDFKDVETYVSLTKTIRADVGIAPLTTSKFNSCKSALKWMEFTAIGIPTVASNASPYKEAITSGETGILANTEEEWYDALKALLQSDDKCCDMVRAAVDTINEKHDAKSVADDWKRTIFGG